MDHLTDSVVPSLSPFNAADCKLQNYYPPEAVILLWRRRLKHQHCRRRRGRRGRHRRQQLTARTHKAGGGRAMALDSQAIPTYIRCYSSTGKHYTE